MTAHPRSVAVAIAFVLVTGSAAGAQVGSLSKYRGYGADGVASETGRYWVEFADKGEAEVSPGTSLQGANLPISERSLRRRIVRANRETVAWHDLPVVNRYIRSITDSGIEVRTVSRFLNAVSVSADMAQLEWLDRQDFVRAIKPVLSFRRSVPSPDPEPAAPGIAPPGTWTLDYGPSEGQLGLIRVPPVHEMGYSGSGIMIGVFDTGFKTELPAIAAMDIEAAYDFINDDADVSDNDGYQQDHGTKVLSVAGAAVPGQLYGPAFGAKYVLAKTEDVGDEYRQEEDFFIAALEWADSIGCDIVTASLGYNDWYTFADMDGNTAPITIACDLAVAVGITVITSAGNERFTSWGHITAPADGDSVIAVGAVTPTGVIADFSSPGPTADGRIKPDICAQGTSVRAATTTGGFTNSFAGTSAAAPLAAGGIALLLEMHPTWGPIEVREAVWTTGRHREGLTYPNNDYGYGLLDVQAAAAPHLPEFPDEITAYPNPFSVEVSFRLPRETTGRESFYVFAVDGSRVYEQSLPPGETVCSWEGKNDRRQKVAAGMYLVKFAGIGDGKILKVLKIE